ncbi:hypothetical protein ABZZ44_34285 [Streptomyces sp. NPDC006460]|uniref:hypothetical protein n=1 Tax=Streptomyces sp. NPDC006460 TaxID=3154304 RepID=UPI0033AADD6E
MIEDSVAAGSFTALGEVTAPSGLLVLGMAGWIDGWSRVGRPLSERAGDLAPTGGRLTGPDEGGSGSEQGEAIVVPAASDRPLPVRALTSPSPFDDEPTISVLEVDLGLPWPGERAPAPVALGDLPVDRCGMVIADAVVLDSFVGIGGESVDGLADLTYWGRYEDEAHAVLGGERIPQSAWGDGPRGWLDLPLAEAREREACLATWLAEGPGRGLVWSVEPHNHFHLLQRAAWPHPLQQGLIDLDGIAVLGIGWNQGDHAMRHRGERAHGQVYPATLEPRAGGTVLRWTIPPWQPDEDEAEAEDGGADGGAFGADGED